MKKTILLIFLLLLSATYHFRGNLEATETLVFIPTISPVENQPIASDQELMHSLILLSDKVVVNVFSNETSLSYDSLNDYLEKHSSSLNNQTLSIAVAKGTDYMDVIRVVDMIANSSIKNYKLVRYE
jgi:biopolymer transport protein ExbD